MKGRRPNEGLPDGGGRPPYAAELARLLELAEVPGHELVYGELLIGDRGGRRKLLAAYERMHEAAGFSPRRRRVRP